MKILDIRVLGDPILRKATTPVEEVTDDIRSLISDMFDTMYAAEGIGLAAPQVNKDIRLFVVDSSQIFQNQEDEDKGKYPDEPGIKKVFINARIKSLNGSEWVYNEGCLSIPKIREDISRNEEITIEY